MFLVSFSRLIRSRTDPADNSKVCSLWWRDRRWNTFLDRIFFHASCCWFFRSSWHKHIVGFTVRLWLRAPNLKRQNRRGFFDFLRWMLTSVKVDAKLVAFGYVFATGWRQRRHSLLANSVNTEHKLKRFSRNRALKGFPSAIERNVFYDLADTI